MNMYAELGACLGNGCLHVYGIGCMSAELGACLGNGCLHVCGIGCMYAELGACMRSWVHVCGVGCMSGERSLACLRSWVLVWEQGAFPSPQAGPGPWPQARAGPWPQARAPGALLCAARRLRAPCCTEPIVPWGAPPPPDPPNKSPLGLPDAFLADTYWLTHV